MSPRPEYRSVLFYFLPCFLCSSNTRSVFDQDSVSRRPARRLRNQSWELYSDQNPAISVMFKTQNGCGRSSSLKDIRTGAVFAELSRFLRLAPTEIISPCPNTTSYTHNYLVHITSQFSNHVFPTFIINQDPLTPITAP
jgi:hypothetical protein